MARLTDIPKVHRSIGLWELSKRVIQQLDEDNILSLAAAMAYSWLFAIFPFLIFLITLLPFMPDVVKDKARTEIRQVVYEWLPPRGAGAIWDNVNDVLSKPRKGLLSVGLLFCLWSASGGLNMSISAVERCYEITVGPPFWKQRPKAIIMTIVMVLLMLLVLALLPIGTLAIHGIERHWPQFAGHSAFWFGKMARYPLAILLMFSAVHLLYYYGPAIRQRCIFFTPGAVLCVACWSALGFMMRLYVEKVGGFDETYGAVGGIAIVLMFFYFGSLVLLVGAELNSEIDFCVLGVPRGSRDFTQRPPQEPVAM